jgi:hypothetical protein
MKSPSTAVLVLAAILSLGALAQAQVRFRFTPSGGSNPTHEFTLSGNPATDDNGTVTETDLSTGSTTTRSWKRDGNDIVVESSPGTERARFKNGRIQGDGAGTMFPGISGDWVNIDYELPDPGD